MYRKFYIRSPRKISIPFSPLSALAMGSSFSHGPDCGRRRTDRLGGQIFNGGLKFSSLNIRKRYNCLGFGPNKSIKEIRCFSVGILLPAITSVIVMTELLLQALNWPYTVFES